MADPASLSTSRLTLTALSPEHASELYPVFADKVTLRYWHHPPHRAVQNTAEMIRSMVAVPQACWWLVRLRESNQAIGCVGYLGTTIPGMGYIVHSAFWRQGYGTEAVTAALEYGYTALSLNRVELWIHESNLASQQLARKLGFAQRGQFHSHYSHEAGAQEMRVFGLRADEWAARHQKQPANVLRDVPFFSIRPILPVRDVTATVAFYRDCLGFQAGYLSGDPIQFAIMTRGEWTTEQMHIHLRASVVISIVHLYIMIGPSIDRLHEEYLARGAAIVHPPITQPWGIREFSIEDNNGHSITFGSTA